MGLKKKLDTYTTLSTQKRRKVFKWIVNQGEEIALMAFEEQKKHLFKLSKIEEDNRSILYLSSLYLAANELYELYHAQTSKNREMDINQVKGATHMQAKKFKKNIQSDKFDKLLNIKNKILFLKDEENLSYRQISELLKRYHRLEVSHSYIATFYHKIKDKNG